MTMSIYVIITYKEYCDKVNETMTVNDNITMNRKWKIKMYKNDH